MSAASKLAKARETFASGNAGKAIRLGWDAANGAMTERDPLTLAGVESLALEISVIDPSARTLAAYCTGVLAQGPSEVRAENVFSKYFRREGKRMKCPRCAESIAKEATICRFCGVEIVAS